MQIPFRQRQKLLKRARMLYDSEDRPVRAVPSQIPLAPLAGATAQIDLAHHAPHTPIEAKATAVKHFEGKLEAKLKHQNAAYAAMVGPANPYGDGQAADRIVEAIARWHRQQQEAPLSAAAAG